MIGCLTREGEGELHPPQKKLTDNYKTLKENNWLFSKPEISHCPCLTLATITVYRRSLRLSAEANMPKRRAYLQIWQSAGVEFITFSRSKCQEERCQTCMKQCERAREQTKSTCYIKDISVAFGLLNNSAWASVYISCLYSLYVVYVYSNESVDLCCWLWN